jgi:hypothetical protein
MDRLEKIRAKRAELDADAMKKVNQMMENITLQTSNIKALESRIKEIMVVADEMVKNKIRFGGAWIHLGMEHGDIFETNGITHQLGFIFEYQKGRGRDFPYRLSVVGIGIQGGGCDYQDIVVDRNGDIIKNPLNHVIGCWTQLNAYNDFCNKTSRFLKEFDEFERKFYDYVDNL